MTKSVTDILKAGGIGVIPTDTIYGLVGSALNQETVERIYQVRKRSPDKPSIILISSIEDLKLFGIKPNPKTLEILNRYWPGQISIVLPLDSEDKEGLDSRSLRLRATLVDSLRGNDKGFKDDKENYFEYLHRGTGTLAFRLPAQAGSPETAQLLEILKEAGPLVAPSANPEGQSPAQDITEAKKYFGNKVDFYLDG